MGDKTEGASQGSLRRLLRGGDISLRPGGAQEQAMARVQPKVRRGGKSLCKVIRAGNNLEGGQCGQVSSASIPGPSEVRAPIFPGVLLGRGVRGLWNVGLVSLHQTRSPLRCCSWRNKRGSSTQTPAAAPRLSGPLRPCFDLACWLSFLRGTELSLGLGGEKRAEP